MRMSHSGPIALMFPDYALPNVARMLKLNDNLGKIAGDRRDSLEEDNGEQVSKGCPNYR